MNKTSMIALGVALALGLSACTPAQKDETATIQPAAPLISGIDLTAIDSTVKVQDDLFRHVNGHWLNTTEIPADKSRYGIFNVLHDDTQEHLKALIQEAAAATDFKAGSNTQKLGDMYNSYMDIDKANELGLAPIQQQLDSIAAIKTTTELAQKMGELYVLGVGGPFNFYVSPDAKDPVVVTMYLYQSGLTLPDRDYYSKDEQKYVDFRAATEKYMADILTKAGNAQPADAASRIMALERDIAAKHISRVESRDAEKNYNQRNKADVQALLAGFDWQAYADASGIGAVDNMVVRNLPYFEQVSSIMTGHDLQTWKDYLSFNLVDSYASRLSQDMVDLHFAFHSTTLSGIPEQQPRWKRAVNATSGVLGEVLGQQYVERHFTPQAKAKMDALVKNLIAAYGDSIKQLEWMSDETKTKALEKLAAFTPKIGYPDKWRDYSGLEIKADDLVGNYLRYSKFDHMEDVAKIGKPVDKDEWGMTPQTINAYYSPVRNEIVFPAGILQPPMFDMQADDAVNYGAIGAVIGHEIGHGFDDQGSKYDGQGNLRSWWTEADRAAFDVLAQKLAAQYDQFEAIEGLNVNGQLTLGENIGDLAGVTIGYQAYLKSLAGQPAVEIDGLSGTQRFFMGYAQVWRSKQREDALRSQLLSDPHSPGEFRVNGIAPNVDAFYKAFDVKEGDGMYLAPAERVKIW
ncbi:M13 family metallopeptidase [Paraglaciecola hydrolytica]|uniref:Peptidase M13 n=1 Tax=Paraglaciecola hydrolytica TaxID=1799789 RepID=A0A148KL58_9ALTE|nr:M13-type metalloendopeptidase [Paraglaciecola hydrolytica]KXI27044.1 peptidase M13 [Paraglaciecola hydrolytica]